MFGVRRPLAIHEVHFRVLASLEFINQACVYSLKRLQKLLPRWQCELAPLRARRMPNLSEVHGRDSDACTGSTNAMLKCIRCSEVTHIAVSLAMMVAQFASPLGKHYHFATCIIDRVYRFRRKRVQQTLACLQDVAKAHLNGKADIEYAVRNGDEKLVQDHIIADPRSVDAKLPLFHGCATIFMLAAESGDLSMMELLIRNGCNIHAKDILGHNALSKAAQVGSLAAVKLLIQMGFDVNEQTRPEGNQICSCEETPLILAAEYRHFAVAKLLIQSGSNVNAKRLDNGAEYHGDESSSLFGRSTARPITPIMHAAQNGHLALVQLLVNSNADLSVRNREGCTALQFAIQEKHTTVVKFLRSNKAPL
jgi:ankyrin repeat protein